MYLRLDSSSVTDIRELRFESVSCVISSSAEQISQDFGDKRIGDRSLRRIPCVAGFGELAGGNVSYAAMLLLLECLGSSVFIRTPSMPGSGCVWAPHPQLLSLPEFGDDIVWTQVLRSSAEPGRLARMCVKT